jgi:hypothetical protein
MALINQFNCNRTEGSEWVVRDFREVAIYQRKNDRFMDATAMCKATGKVWHEYWRLSSTKEFLAALTTVTGLSLNDLVQARRGGIVQEQGTWVHPRVAIHLAQWCSPEFAALVTGWVEELLTTGTVTNKPMSQMDILRQQMAVLEEQERRISDVSATANQALDVANNVQQRANEAHYIANAAIDTHTNNFGYYTVLGWCRLHNLPCDLRAASKYGKELTKICKAAGISMPKQKDTRFGQVNSYPEDVLQHYFAQRL